MKLYLVNRISKSLHVIEMTDVDVLNKLPSITIMNKETVEIINYNLRKFGLTLLSGSSTKYNLHPEQVLALILSSSLPLEDRGVTAYRDLSLPLPINQHWWHFDDPHFDDANHDQSTHKFLLINLKQ